jgi:DNA-directed RNA polymerase subunit N (RpoN/RPB10)
MGFFEKLTRFFTSKSGAPVDWIEVRCGRCGEVIRTRVNLYNDLSLEYDESGRATYFCRKVLIGEGRCFQRIQVELTYDANRRLLSREISGGEFVEG